MGLSCSIDKMTAFAALLFYQVHLFDMHALIYGFAHIIYRKKRNRDAGKRFHFDARPALAADQAPGFDGAFLRYEGKSHGTLGQRQNMTQGNEIARFFLPP